MNKMKSIVMTVLILVFVGFSLQAETKINENKLTDLSNVRKICNITYTSQAEDGNSYELDNGKGYYIIAGGHILCFLVRNGELYGRLVLNEDGVIVSYNMHDRLCHVNRKIDVGLRQYITSAMRSTIFYAADKLGLLEYVKK